MKASIFAVLTASIFAVLTASILTAFTLEAVEIIRADGGSVQTDLGFNIKVNSKGIIYLSNQSA